MKKNNNEKIPDKEDQDEKITMKKII